MYYSCSEVRDCITKYYTKYKGSGVIKLHPLIKFSLELYTEREIQLYINSTPKAQHLNPKFDNKVHLKPVGSSGVMNLVQIDLVDMSNSPASKMMHASTYS